MSEGGTVNVDGTTCRIHYFTGKVLSTRKDKETQVSSSAVYSGNSNNPQVHVSSTTVDHHEFFLADATGKERAFKMVNFDFPCREGNTLTVVWAIPEGVTEGPYIEVHNHSTGERHVIEPKRIASYFRKPFWMIAGAMVAALLVIGLVLGWILGMISVLVPYYYFKFRSVSAAKSLIASDGMRQLDTQLAQIKPPVAA